MYPRKGKAAAVGGDHFGGSRGHAPRPVATVLSMSAGPATRVRREPPAFRAAVVARAERQTPHLVRVTLRGPDIADFEPPEPGGSIRLLIPDTPGAELVIPVWDGNAFMHRDGRRPVIRTLTPLRHDPGTGELDVDVVLHGEGPLSDWAATAEPGQPAAVSGPGRGYSIDAAASGFVLAGDETAMPAIGQLVAALPLTTPATVIVDVAHPDARLTLTDRATVDVRWVDRPPGSAPGGALVAAVVECEITPDTRVWVAGEAAAVQRIRRHLFDDLGISRAHAMVRGYWKHGRAGTDDMA